MHARLAAAWHGGACTIAGVWLLIACAPIAVDAFEKPDSATLPSAVDECPDDPNKAKPGGCGCGVPDADFDVDGALDCNEQCPDNADRTSPVGPCGCSSSSETEACAELRALLRNLYKFDGTGTRIDDSVSGMNGTLLHTGAANLLAGLEQLQQNGRLNLDGFGSYVELPDGMISSLGSATFEAWVSWRGGPIWQRIFDFGDNDGTAQSVGATYLFLTASSGNTNGLRVAYSAGGFEAETVTDGPGLVATGSFPPGSPPQHVAVVIDAATGAMRLYAEGAEVSSVVLLGALAAIRDTNNWLGRSNYAVDPAFFGSLIEFRIYGAALSAAQLDTSFRAGPGALN